MFVLLGLFNNLIIKKTMETKKVQLKKVALFQEYSLTHSHNSINVNFLSEGVYILNLMTNNNSVTRKLIITE